MTKTERYNVQDRPCIRCGHANKHHSGTGRCQVAPYFFQCPCQLPTQAWCELASR